MQSKFAIVALCLFICLAAPLLIANAAAPRNAATQIPVGKPVIVNMQAEAVTDGQGAYTGSIIAYDQQWLIMRVPDDKIIWCPIDRVANITVDASVLNDKT